MTVVVNAVAAKMGGAANYIRELALELGRLPEAGQFIFYVPPEQADLGRSLPPHIDWRVTRIGHAGALRRFWWDQVILRRILRREGATVLYSTANFAMFFCPVPQLLLVRDALYFSELYRKRFLSHKPVWHRSNFALRTWLVRSSVRCAERVITPSETLAGEIRRVLPGTSVTSNPYGRPPIVPPRNEDPKPGSLLYVSGYADHKNFSVLLEAMEILDRKRPGYFRLTCTADIDDPRYRYSARRTQDRLLAQRLASRCCVSFVGEVSAEECSRLYATNAIFIFPSLCESFGQPVVEALSYGLPVICADTVINREVGGEAVLYFDPDDAEGLAARILQVETSETLRHELRGRARGECTRFSWETHAATLRNWWAEMTEHRQQPLRSVRDA